METIVANPKNKTEVKAILHFLKQMKVKADVYKEPTKAQVLKSIEQGAKEAQMYLAGKIKLKKASELLNEL
ncbi:MAG: hypothetical protein ABJA37_02265 [Ferruginibacter sp.]